MDATEVLISERLILMGLAVLIGGLIVWISSKRGFYDLPLINTAQTYHFPLKPLFIAFFLFFFMELVVAPVGYSIVTSWGKGESLFSLNRDLSDADRSCLSVIGAIVTVITVIGYSLMLNRDEKRAIFGERTLSSNILIVAGFFLVGSATWLAAYPWIVAFGQGMETVIDTFHLGVHVDQVAVKHLRGLIDNPALFWSMAFTVAFIVPVLEEVLFRGYLQGWFRGRFSRKWAIVMTSIIFALFHFSSGQHLENVELLGSLFILSCYLGFLREKKDSVVASIGLHSTFNAVNVLILYLS